MNIAKVIGGLVMAVGVPFGVAQAAATADVAAPTSTLIEQFAAAVGPDGAVSKVIAHGQTVTLQGSARDPSAVLAALSESTLIGNPHLLLMANDRKQAHQAFVVTANLEGPPTSSQVSVNSGSSQEELVAHTRQALDSRLPSACQLISNQRSVADAAQAASVGTAMRWRCNGALPQVISALRELESGVPALSLSDYAVYVQSQGPVAVGAPNLVEMDLRFTATAAMLATH